MKRIFLAIGLPSEIQQKLGGALAWMKEFQTYVKIVPPENFHVTLKFLGPVADDRIDGIAEEIQAAMKRETFQKNFLDLHMGNWGVFPDAENPAIFWAGVGPMESLQPLAEFFEDVFGKLGFSKESRPYTPHVTVARVNQNPPLEFLRQWNAMKPLSALSFRADHLTLYANVPSRPSLPEYRNLRNFLLTDPSHHNIRM